MKKKDMSSKSKKKTNVAFAMVGRINPAHLPQLGLIYLVNVVNTSSSKYHAEYFHFGFSTMSLGQTYLDTFNYLASWDKLMAKVLPELPMVELLIHYIREKQGIKLNMGELEKSSQHMGFINHFCMQYALNPFFYLRRIQNFFLYIEERIIPQLKDFPFVCIGTHTGNFFWAILASEIIRIRTQATTIAGGPQPTAAYTYIKPLVEKGWFFDVLVRGDAEDHIEKILDLASKKKAFGYDCYEDKGYKIQNLPIIKNWNYDCALKKGYKFDFLLYDYSRGCPAQCKFCGERTLHGRLALKDPVDAADDLIRLVKYHKHSRWRLTDSMVNFNLDHMRKFMARIVDYRLKEKKNKELQNLFMHGYIAAPVSKETARLLKIAGFHEAWLGMESFYGFFLSEVNKRANLKEMFQTVNNLLESRISIALLVISPNTCLQNVEPDFLYQTTKAMLEFSENLISSGILKRNNVYVRFSAITPFIIPLTSTYHQEMVSQGRLENWEEKDFFNGCDKIFFEVPKSYILHGNYLQSAIIYDHMLNLINNFFPIDRNSTSKKKSFVEIFDDLARYSESDLTKKNSSKLK